MRADREPDLDFDDPLPLPPADFEGRVGFAEADIWFGSFGDGPPVILLHGALGSGDDWSNQVPSLIEAGFRVILIDNRGRGRSSAGGLPLSYELMAQEVVAVMDELGIESAAIAGWSDGAIIALVIALNAPDRIDSVFAYAGNMDLGGVNASWTQTSALDHSFKNAMADYQRLSETPDEAEEMLGRMNALMTSQPNYSADEIAQIFRPAAIVHGEFDEFIRLEHAEYLAATIPDAMLIVLAGVSHFAPWQDPQAFNNALLEFLRD